MNVAGKSPKKGPEKHENPSPVKKSGTKEDDEFLVRANTFVRERSTLIQQIYDFLSPPLGSGAFGEVRRAKYRATGELRAVKILKKAAQSEKDRERLNNEVNILKALVNLRKTSFGLEKLIEFRRITRTSSRFWNIIKTPGISTL